MTSTSRNCVSGGSAEARLPQTGVIHQSLALAPARKRARMSFGCLAGCFFEGKKGGKVGGE